MSSHIEQCAWGCNRCGKQTLHQRSVNEVNHILHLLLSLFCCGWWIPIWILLIILNGFEHSAFLCTICGQTAGQLTAEQVAAAAMKRQLAKQSRRAEFGKLVDSTGLHLGQTCIRLFGIVRVGIIATTREVVQMPRRIDMVLRVVSGEGNDILFWFLRIATIATVLSVVIGGAAFALLVVSRLLG